MGCISAHLLALEMSVIAPFPVKMAFCSKYFLLHIVHNGLTGMLSGGVCFAVSGLHGEHGISAADIAEAAALIGMGPGQPEHLTEPESCRHSPNPSYTAIIRGSGMYLRCKLDTCTLPFRCPLQTSCMHCSFISDAFSTSKHSYMHQL